jgi:Tfp pilus assembly protein PilX
MRTHARDDQGFVLVTAIILLTVMLAFGAALVAYTNSQQSASAHERYDEAAFNLAEAALNAQIGQLSRHWPGTENFEKNNIVLKTCTPSTSTKENLCPDKEILEKAYPSTGATCSGTEAWGSPLTNKWDTYVRADEGGSTYFNSETEKIAASWAPTSQKLWVRAVGVVNCHVVTVVSLASEQTQHVAFPEEAFSANWFVISNKGNKVLVERKSKGGGQPGKTHVRCKAPYPNKKCAEYEPGQISPEYEENTEGSGISLTSAQLESIKSQAESEGRFFSGPGKCPASIEEVSGSPTYVEGCELTFKGNGEANTEAKPGFLVLASGTIEVSGTTKFYGIIYAANLKNSSEPIVVTKGNGHVIGEIIVDGKGGIEFGDSHENLEYGPGAAQNFELITSAAATRNSFRILPSGQ